MFPLSTPPNPFDPAQLSKTIDAAVASIPPGQHGAILLHGDLIDGTPTGGFTIVEKVDDHWAVSVDGSISENGAGHLDPSIGFIVKGSW